MSEPLDQLRTTLRSNKQSLTKPRQLVFAALLGQEPLSMAELYILCRGKLDRASLYRTIALFEHLGIVQRLSFGWKYKIELSNTFQPHHHHLTCVRCGKIIPLIEDKILENRVHTLAKAQNFQAADHQIEIRGRCVECQKAA